MAEVLTLSLTGGAMAELKEIFYSKEELKQVRADLGEESGGGFKGMVKAQLEIAKVSAVKDPNLLAELQERLVSSGFNAEGSRFSGSYVMEDEGSLRLDLGVRCLQPSMIYRFLFDDYLNVPIRVICRPTASGCLLTVEQPLKRPLDVLGCVVTVLTFAACIIPGLVWLYLTRTQRGAWDRLQQNVVFAALRSRLAPHQIATQE